MQIDILSIAVTAITAAVGAYFGSFLKKKGEVAAIKNSQEQLLEYAQKNQKVISAVQASFQRESADYQHEIWVEQQHWLTRKELYIEVLDLLLSIRSDCIEAEKFLNEVPKFITPDGELDEEQTQKMMKKAEAIYNGPVEDKIVQLKELSNRKCVLCFPDAAMRVLSDYFNSESIRRETAYKDFERDFKDGKVSVYDSPNDSYELSLYHYLVAAELAYRRIAKIARGDKKLTKTSIGMEVGTLS